MADRRLIDTHAHQPTAEFLEDKVMFGTDYPMIRPEECLESFAADTDFDESTQRKLLFENAERFLDLK